MKNGIFKSYRKTKLTKRIFIIVIALMLIAGGALTFCFRKSFDGSGIMDILSLAATLIGTVFIAVELKNSQVVTCCDMLIQMNNYFHDNDSLMQIYTVLESQHISAKKKQELWDEVRESDVAAYCTFFENIYLLIHNKIAKMSDVDSLFGYRFFLFVNNPYVQENFILPTSSSYSEIFELYEIWIKYRDNESKLNGQGKLVVGYQYRFSNYYLENKLYLYDFGLEQESFGTKKSSISDKTFCFRSLSFSNLSEIIELQERATCNLTKEIYYPLSRDEIIESMHLDTIIGAYDGESLVAFSVIVKNRKSERNLCKNIPGYENSPEKVLTFDAVAVDVNYRGNGLQQLFINTSFDLAKQDNQAEIIAATVSPENQYSLNNFSKCGFTTAGKNITKYEKLSRNILIKKL